MKKKSPFAKGKENLNFREHLGLSLEDVAGFCGVKISTLGMIESGQRHWPWKLDDNHLQLNLASIQAQNEPLQEVDLPKLETYEIENLEDELQTLALEQIRSKKKLSKMKFQFEQAKTLLKTCFILESKYQDPDSKEFLAIRYWKNLAEDRLRKFGRIPQKRLEFKVEEVKRKMEMLNRFMVQP